MASFLTVMSIGFLATLLMTIFMYFVHWVGYANGDMIRAIGSFFLRRLEGAFALGAAIHFLAGIAFGFFYAFLISLAPLETMAGHILLGALIGLAHGFIVSFSLVILVAEHHPLLYFRPSGFPVALAYIMGHVIYGASVGFLMVIFQVSFL